ncbi:hypothetical protein CANARDRAFT_192786 [[Candida] arabinofermentans NRRL YB-2248]|uniref:Uncharacterized protein n=1 Tax=[Candida] arabinofermentans NRRL YB-2248 TaxID=983967 RepID=A0A1E4T7F0_9ASCO|nr:hypothetical protein CANARDRAFT_192786 [[Candida] arabinofermentans NRRL YB-2248]
MAGASDKKQATANVKILKEIHTISLAINLITIIGIFIFHRPSTKKYYFIWSIPSILCQYILEKSGRPKYETNLQGYQILLKSGENLQQSGLTEYMFDVIYLTLICDLLMIILGSNKVWLLLLVIPGFAIFKLKWLFSMVLNMIWPSRRGGQKSNQQDDLVNGGGNGEPVKSKRQAKLEARNGKQKVRYR